MKRCSYIIRKEPIYTDPMTLESYIQSYGSQGWRLVSFCPNYTYFHTQLSETVKLECNLFVFEREFETQN